jgi:hypothetical protein
MAKISPKTGGNNRTTIAPDAAPASAVDTAALNMSKNKNNNAAGGTAYTTAAVQVSPANDAEFVDAPGLQSRFGIKRSLAYVLLADGAIRGVSLRRRNQTRGKRLFSVDSVREYLNRQMESGARDGQ